MTDEKFLDKKMDRREFLKKAGIGGAGASAWSFWCICFFRYQDSSTKKALDGDEDISFYGKHQAGITNSHAEGLLLGGARSSHN